MAQKDTNVFPLVFGTILIFILRVQDMPCPTQARLLDRHRKVSRKPDRRSKQIANYKN